MCVLPRSKTVCAFVGFYRDETKVVLASKLYLEFIAVYPIANCLYREMLPWDTYTTG